MVYETSRLLANQSYQHWVSQELFSFGWFLTIIVLAVVYTIWLKLVDKSKLRDLLLLGSLCAVGFLITDIVFLSFFGTVEFKIRLFPFDPPIFLVSVTKAPIVYMLVQQYTSSWKGYLLWASIGAAVLAFVLLPIYSLLGILQLHNWNYFYQFLLILTGGILARAALLWITGIEQIHPNSK
ncbi:conserved membrane hypothetical protein [Candidatus Desulfosporosinus infrequens]|uniref:Uncharacterized protein n=1 Tax=Candidatus Desulfosporosinus infrequens TaxID=2043169 RepID=A0A2U3KNK9_9FIRM|nr:conserved membrane hypothetical protein [Candidatus Desulfosporosinus infrequens]